ncbi:peptidylprolyl isomerase [Tolypothrix sp. PCC 7910]|uniref:peptidylprolyl isomerase n=1 Tax=Tolypothrix sp. PCC 7910 TaxID=2099387 RepID=UPI000D2166B4|nr:peptidylprolyl isomerase [Tolypothrix sp. PCC 7910]AVH79431.1 PpiC-type peptidyl-prolyl cis-transl isomerase [Tolypothrix sp. PCC 7910]QIR37110.1 peptidylprolyl isomerase [Tolypothrix sp. PCC 7910]
MSYPITITSEDILHQIKLTCKIPEIAEQILNRKVIVSAAEEAGIQVEVEELQNTADQIRLANKLNSADDTWQWLEKNALSLDDFEEIIYQTIISNKLAFYLFADKIEPYFFEHQLDYFSAVMYEVILDDEDLAIELFYAIQEGEISFYDVAHKYIQDTEQRRKLGYKGVVKRHDMKSEISAMVFAAQPPQIIKPIVTSSGIHLILVEEIIQPQLDDHIRTKIFTELFSEWLKHKTESINWLLSVSPELV